MPVASDLNAERGDLAVDGLNEAELGLVLVAGDHSSGVWRETLGDAEVTRRGARIAIEQVPGAVSYVVR